MPDYGVPQHLASPKRSIYSHRLVPFWCQRPIDKVSHANKQSRLNVSSSSALILIMAILLLLSAPPVQMPPLRPHLVSSRPLKQARPSSFPGTLLAARRDIVSSTPPKPTFRTRPTTGTQPLPPRCADLKATPPITFGCRVISADGTTNLSPYSACHNRQDKDRPGFCGGRQSTIGCKLQREVCQLLRGVANELTWAGRGSAVVANIKAPDAGRDRAYRKPPRGGSRMTHGRVASPSSRISKNDSRRPERTTNWRITSAITV